jgi:hypothetical protein
MLTRHAPFHELNEMGAAMKIVGGDRPSRPMTELCTDALWPLITSCWTHDPKARPSMTNTLFRLRGGRDSGVQLSALQPRSLTLVREVSSADHALDETKRMNFVRSMVDARPSLRGAGIQPSLKMQERNILCLPSGDASAARRTGWSPCWRTCPRPCLHPHLPYCRRGKLVRSCAPLAYPTLLIAHHRVQQARG